MADDDDTVIFIDRMEELERKSSSSAIGVNMVMRSSFLRTSYLVILGIETVAEFAWFAMTKFT